MPEPYRTAEFFVDGDGMIHVLLKDGYEIKVTRFISANVNLQDMIKDWIIDGQVLNSAGTSKVIY